MARERISIVPVNIFQVHVLSVTWYFDETQMGELRKIRMLSVEFCRDF